MRELAHCDCVDDRWPDVPCCYCQSSSMPNEHPYYDETGEVHHP